MTETEKGKKKKGFALMKERDPALLAKLASRGGKTAHENGTAHEFTSVEAHEAGKLGGKASAAAKKKR